MKMLTNKYLNLGYVSIIAIILGLVINTTFVNTVQADDEKKVELTIKGMGCEMCADTIKTLVMKCAGVKGCEVSYKEGKATVEIEAGKAKTEEIVETVEGAGFIVDEWEIPEVY
jgi:copper chaperone CopZ